jgi:hypothetical protein
MTTELLPRFVRVEDAARALCISRTSAYELANRYLATQGATGLPAVRLGRSIRIPLAALHQLATTPDRQSDSSLAISVGGHEIVPIGGHEAARWWPTVLPIGGQWFCPR